MVALYMFHEYFLCVELVASLIFYEQKSYLIFFFFLKLKTELMKGHVFEGWHEGEINFAPSYKYYPNSGLYFGRDHKRKHKKRRAPAW